MENNNPSHLSAFIGLTVKIDRIPFWIYLFEGN